MMLLISSYIEQSTQQSIIHIWLQSTCFNIDGSDKLCNTSTSQRSRHVTHRSRLADLGSDPLRKHEQRPTRKNTWQSWRNTQQSIGVRQWIASVGHCKLPNRQFAIDRYTFFFDDGQQRGETIRQSVEPDTPFLFGWLWGKIVEFICWERAYYYK